jgi:hypothetical protein
MVDVDRIEWLEKVDGIDSAESFNSVESGIIAAYGGGGRHVYFLEGVPLDVVFTAAVDWGGKAGNRLEFNGANNGLGLSKSLAVDTFPVGGKLEVVAVAAGGTDKQEGGLRDEREVFGQSVAATACVRTRGWSVRAGRDGRCVFRGWG